MPNGSNAPHLGHRAEHVRILQAAIGNFLAWARFAQPDLMQICGGHLQGANAE